MEDKKMTRIGIVILVLIFGLFYGVTTFLLDKKVSTNQVEVNLPDTDIPDDKLSNAEYIDIIKSFYNDIKILYDVVNNKFKVDQNDTLTVGEITYKRINNFDEVMNNIFTENGVKEYLKDLNSFFAITDNGVYLAGNLVTYQTYYFRGDDTNIYITDSSNNEIKAIIYEKWTSNNTNTLATIKLIKVSDAWRVDDVTILANK